MIRIKNNDAMKVLEAPQERGPLKRCDYDKIQRDDVVTRK